MSSSEVKASIKQEDKKAKKSFFILIAVGALIGFFAGFGTAWLRDLSGADSFLAAVENMINQISLYAGFVTSIAVAIANTILVRKSRALFEVWDEEEEETLLEIDKKLSIANMLANVNTIFTYVMMPIGFAYWVELEGDMAVRLVKAGVFLLGVFLSMVVLIMTSAKVVNLTKEMNPEKRGSAYDVKFQSKWLDSCDEAEKLTVYKAAFKSYKVTSGTCMILWMTCMFGMLLCDWDMVPVIMIGIIWMASILGYYAETVRLSKDGAKIQE